MIINYYKQLRGSGLSWWACVGLIIAAPVLYLYGKLTETK